jgi:Zn-dependent protease with chaperone function
MFILTHSKIVVCTPYSNVLFFEDVVWSHLPFSGLRKLSILSLNVNEYSINSLFFQLIDCWIEMSIILVFKFSYVVLLLLHIRTFVYWVLIWDITLNLKIWFNTKMIMSGFFYLNCWFVRRLYGRFKVNSWVLEERTHVFNFLQIWVFKYKRNIRTLIQEWTKVFEFASKSF